MTVTLAPSAPPARPPTGRAARIRRQTATSHGVRLGILLIATAVLYHWRITINGMGNQYYAAAAQAGTAIWKALLFGSLDAQNFITVDKPPLSQWVMGLAGHLFGFSSASMLIPQALTAGAAVAQLYGAVNRISGPGAGAALALTPVVAIGGFAGTDPTPTLQQFRDDVARHRISYYLGSRGTNRQVPPEAADSGAGWDARPHADILRWVHDHFPSTTVGGVTTYDLTKPKSGPNEPVGAASPKR